VQRSAPKERHHLALFEIGDEGVKVDPLERGRDLEANAIPDRVDHEQQAAAVRAVAANLQLVEGLDGEALDVAAIGDGHQPVVDAVVGEQQAMEGLDPIAVRRVEQCRPVVDQPGGWRTAARGQCGQQQATDPAAWPHRCRPRP
jgi:hypothetical protein